ncbi:MAG: hypothetical protein LBQ90_05740 [Synergistaceae bacterium]|nr:hypothetical protein [Synergistaceae bacterium]
MFAIFVPVSFHPAEQVGACGVVWFAPERSVEKRPAQTGERSNVRTAEEPGGIRNERPFSPEKKIRIQYPQFNENTFQHVEDEFRFPFPDTFREIGFFEGLSVTFGGFQRESVEEFFPKLLIDCHISHLPVLHNLY